MKKLSAFVLVIALVFCSAAVSAKSGDIAGHIYSTDILAVISGNEVPSYNIGGRTVIIAEDLETQNVGISYSYDEEQRLLAISAGTASLNNSRVPRGLVGEILGEVYETDIQVTLNGIPIQGYNIGGKTAVCIEDIGDLQDSPNLEYGYSKYAARAEWNESDRIIYLDFADERFENSLASMVDRYVFYYDDNVLTAEYDDMNFYYSDYGMHDGKTFFNNTEEFSKQNCVIHPLYLSLGGEREEIGICFVRDEGTYINISDYTYVVSKLNEYKEKHRQKLTYDEIIKRFDDGVNYKTFNRLETENCVMLLAEKLSEENAVVYVAVDKAGDYALVGCSGKYDEMKLEKLGANSVRLSVYPFAAPHGSAVWISSDYNLDEYFR